jgi:hypothetical protein
VIVSKFRERLAVLKQLFKKIDVERFNLKPLKKEEVKEKYQVTIKNKFAALEILDDNGDINKARETIRENKNFGQRVYRSLRFKALKTMV